MPEERIGEDALSEHVIGLKHRLDSANIDLIVDKIETEQMLLELLDYNIDFDRVIFRRTAEKPGAIEHAADGGGTPVSVPVFQGLRNVVNRYEGFVLDLWGVVHDGVTVFPGVVDALERLHAAGKKLFFLSNAPRRAHVVAKQLDSFGITERLHDGVMSSGEATWRYLDTAGRLVEIAWLHLLEDQPRKGPCILEGLDLDPVESVAEADFILVTGPRDYMNSVEPYDTMLQEAYAARNE